MAKNKKKKTTQEEKKAAADYYRLKTDAVDKLINAKDAPEVSDAEIRKYTSKGRFSIPPALKILFVKFWFSGAVCFFFIWGLGTVVVNTLDRLLITAIALGVVNDLFVNHILHSMEPEDRAYDKWIMITLRKNWSIFLNVIYSGLVLFFVYKTYDVLYQIITGVNESANFGVEPLLFGILYMGFDVLFITMKNVLMKIIRDANKNVSGKNK